MTARRLLALAAGLALAGCATAAPPPTATAPTTPRGAPPAKGTAALRPPTPREALAAPHRERAEALQRDGALRAALAEWTIALTIDPGDTTVVEVKRRLEARIERDVAERVQQGRAALAREAHLDARRHFLAALALDPRNTTAFEALRNDVQDVRFISHTVRSGETLGSIAQRYYGDRSRSEVIWEINQLPRNPRLVVGSSLRVPEIPGLPFLISIPGSGPTVAALPPPEIEARPSAPPPDETAPEVDPLLVEVKEAVESKNYGEALVAVDQLLASNPRHPEGADLKKSILYSLGKSQLSQKNYAESYKALTQLAKLAPDYEDSAALLRQARTLSVRQHYAEGLRFYREEKLEEAITEWKLVLDIDPRHPSARKNIEQAEAILKRLEQRRKK
ncbi:MAG TPA: LysM peptidoglycan-binding domain-containing protein [Candidatus Limnocylindria bacterium]|nr:LysM peptidoglycan-binding domain-containing protein [Candidatus Limnocylindria bacterium]